MPIPAAKKDYAADHMVSKTTAPEMVMQGKKKSGKGPNVNKQNFRGNVVGGKYKQGTGGETKLGSLKR